MKKDKHITKVIFRKFKKEGDIIAFFPEITEYPRNYNILSYMHLGQHSTADYQSLISVTKLATEKEYKDLKIELENIGYNLKVLKRANIVYKRN